MKTTNSDVLCSCGVIYIDFLKNAKNNASKKEQIISRSTLLPVFLNHNLRFLWLGMVHKYNAVFWGEKYLKDGVGYLTKTQTPPVEVFVYCIQNVDDSSNIF